MSFSFYQYKLLSGKSFVILIWEPFRLHKNINGNDVHLSRVHPRIHFQTTAVTKLHNFLKKTVLTAAVLKNFAVKSITFKL